MSDRETLVFKFETDNTTPTNVYCLTIINVDTSALCQYIGNHGGQDSIQAGLRRLAEAKRTISHSAFHAKIVRQYYGMDCPNYYDNFAELNVALPGESHKIADWAKRLNIPLASSRGNSGWSLGLQRRCDNGAEIIHRLYRELIGTAV